MPPAAIAHGVGQCRLKSLLEPDLKRRDHFPVNGLLQIDPG
jgi:hypothetical protein